MKNLSDLDKRYTAENMIDYCANKSGVCRRKKTFVIVFSLAKGANVVT